MTAVCFPIPAFLALGLLALAGGACGDDSGSPAAPSAPPLTSTQVEEMLAERWLGGEGAPGTVVEYSSLTCSHCASFAVDALPAIRADYVDSGKVRFVHRDFPLDAVAQDGAVLARCAGARYYDALDLLYRRQETWVMSGDRRSSMKQVLAPIGMTSTEMDSCLASSDLRNGIMRMAQEGRSQHAVSATPTFLVNGQKIEGNHPYAFFAAAIEHALGGN